MTNIVEVVHIYLPTEDASTSTKWIHALSIPREDIERLTIRPLKWLRFATFTVCGAKGDLSVTRGGGIVDYDNVSFDDLADKYYYIPDSMYHLVDYQASNDRCTSSAATPRRSAFREDVFRRDDRCAITGTPREDCDAAHIIPHRNGTQYITYIVRDRSSLYDRLPFSLENVFDINSTENGILLSKDLHSIFGRGAAVFLKTPNFAMEPTDVPRVGQGPTPRNRTTLQHIVPPIGVDRVLQRDIRADWSRDEVQPPPSILLDFMYGVAVVKHWVCDGLGDMLEKRFEDDFSKVLKEVRNRSSHEDDEESDDPQDPDWEPRKGKQKGRKTFSSDASASVSKAMDLVLMLSRAVKRTPSRSDVEEMEKRKKENELRSQGQSCEKVQQWLDLNA